MQLQEYLQMCTLLACKGDAQRRYNNVTFVVPRIHCKDGFTISIQVGNGHYCSSENGYRTYGEEYQTAEWGFPNKPIDGKKYLDEMCFSDDYKNEDSMDSVGCTSVEYLQGLLDEHGGIDVIQTFRNGWNGIGKYFAKGHYPSE